MHDLCDDLAAEHADLERIVVDLPEAQWDALTPSPGWSVRDQISHLWFFDQRALLAIDDPAAFADDAQRLLGVEVGAPDPSVVPGRERSPGALLEGWRSGRSALVERARDLDPSVRIPWYGPAMSARSFLTARLMEAWAHGQDVVDALGATREPTARLRHVAHIGVRARPFSYRINHVDLPPEPVHVHLRAPDGSWWDWDGSDGGGGGDVVAGDALDFCLVVTQRRHLRDVHLDVHGAGAERWMALAQAFAGPPGPGRAPGQFADGG